MRQPFAPISPVPGILHTNYIPTDTETIQIRQAVEGVEPEIARLEREISWIEDESQELVKFQSDHVHWALLTPARRFNDSRDFI